MMTGLFDPPPDLVGTPTPYLVQLVATVVPAVGLLALFGYAVRERRRTGPMLVALLLGGMLCSFNEPFVDVLGNVYLREQGTVVAFHALGRAVPLWAVFFTGLFWGGQVYVFHRLLRSVPTPKRYWQVQGGIFFGACLLELPSTAFGLYDYYGDQPFNPTGYPLGWMVVYQSGPIAAAILHRRPDLFAGRKIVLAALLVPCMEIGFMMFTGIPVLFALHSGQGLLVSTLGAIGSAAIATYVVVQVGTAMVGTGPVAAFREREKVSA